MTGPFVNPAGATPLDPSDIDELIPTWIAFRSELNQVEQENIAQAMLWTSSRRWTVNDLDQQFLKGLHRRMFADVWRWAGQYRIRDTNIGVSWHEVQEAVENLLLDLRTQTVDPANLPWPVQELAVRFHYRLVLIHPFSNGNGRHSRLMADLVLQALGGVPVSWGDPPALVGANPVREEYLAALREVDATGDFTRLLAFVQ